MKQIHVVSITHMHVKYGYHVELVNPLVKVGSHTVFLLPDSFGDHTR
jgi:hypothetical protein